MRALSVQRIFLVTVLLLVMFALPAGATTAGSVFVSGHDSDFHAISGNTTGAQHIIQDGLIFVRNGNTAPILFIQTDLSNLALGDHLNSEQGLMNSGYAAGNANGNFYVKMTAAQFLTANLSQFSAIFVPSDHGGTLNEQDINALDSRSADILAYVNAGGGLMALAEDGFHTGGNASPLFGFLPFLATSTSFQQAETGNVLTPFGASLGLANTDINGNFSHNIFTSTGGMQVVDTNANGNVLSLAFRGQITPTGVVPEPASIWLFGTALIGIATRLRRRK